MTAREGSLFRFSHTHAYPGCRVAVHGIGRKGHGSAQAEFRDGVVVAVRFARAGPAEIRLTVAAHVTRAGTAIVEKTWLLARGAGGRDWKVARRA